MISITLEFSKNFGARPLEDTAFGGAIVWERAGMGDVVNLKRIRKRIERDDANHQAEANRLRFGRTKAERQISQKQTQRATDILDQHLMTRNDSC